MRRPICGLCQRTGNTCTFPNKRNSRARGNRPNQQTQTLRDRVSRIVNLLESNPEALKQIQQGQSLQDPASPLSAEMLKILTSSQSALESTLISNISQSTAYPSNGTTLPSPANGAGTPQSTTSPLRAQPDELLPKASEANNCPISYDEAMFLMKVFFEQIQPCLPLLHEPRFRAHYSDRLSHSSSNQPGADCLDGLELDEKLLLCSMFSLSAHVASASLSETISISGHPERLRHRAHLFYNDAKNMNTTLTYLQGCIVQAFTLYTSGFSAQGWILAGVCVRLAYELGLSEIDDADNPFTASKDWVEVEELRRAWWLVWELDTFGSSVFKKPFSVDRHQLTVKLPISDRFWFNEQPCSSALLLTRPGQSWKSLENCENQSERAWFLIANHLLSVAYGYWKGKQGISTSEKTILENDISCLKLALPRKFDIVTQALCWDDTNYVENNWILGTQLFIASATFMISETRVNDFLRSNNSSPSGMDIESALIERTFSISRILSRWAPEYIGRAHPFLPCSLMPPSRPWPRLHTEPALCQSTEDLTTLALKRFAERWKLASSILGKFAALLLLSTAPLINMFHRYPKDCAQRLSA